MVSVLAAGQFWMEARRRQPGQRESLRTEVGKSEDQRLPQVRFVSLAGKRDARIFGTQMGGCGYEDREITLPYKVLPSLKKGMLRLDRNFFGFDL